MRTIADMHYEEGEKRGIEQGREEGERKDTVESILALLGTRFHPDAVQALKPTIETIDDLPRLKELLLAAPYAQSVEAFTKTLYDIVLLRESASMPCGTGRFCE